MHLFGLVSYNNPLVVVSFSHPKDAAGAHCLGQKPRKEGLQANFIPGASQVEEAGNLNGWDVQNYPPGKKNGSYIRYSIFPYNMFLKMMMIFFETSCWVGLMWSFFGGNIFVDVDHLIVGCLKEVLDDRWFMLVFRKIKTCDMCHVCIVYSIQYKHKQYIRHMSPPGKARWILQMEPRERFPLNILNMITFFVSYIICIYALYTSTIFYQKNWSCELYKGWTYILYDI